MTKVRDIMRPARWTVSPDDTLGRAQRIMAHRRLHHLLVVEAGTVTGLVSERDLLSYRAGAKTGEDWRRTPVQSAMAAPPPAASSDESVASAIDRLAKSAVDVLPIVEQGFLVGQITALDLFETEPRPAEPPAHPVTVFDAMTEPAISTGPTDALLDAARLMIDHHVRHLPVVENDEVIGMLSDRDIRTLAGDPVRFVESREQGGARELSVRDAMTPTALTVHGNRPLSDLVKELTDERIGAVPVIDMDGRLIGIVSYIDALRALMARSPAADSSR